MGATNKEYNDDTDGRDSPEMESLNCCQLKVHRKKIIKEWQKHHLDPTYDGPLKHRSCTDVICLIVFVVFIVAWVALGIYAFADGSLGEIFAPRDSNNKKCGYDQDMEDKPDLIFFDLTKCVLPGSTKTFLRCDTPEVCVETCPTTNFHIDFYRQTNADAAKVAALLICIPSVDKTKIKDWATINEYIKKGQCAEWYLTSISVANRCLPDLTKISDAGQEIQVVIENDKYNVSGITSDSLAKGSDIVEALSTVNEFWNAAARDLMETWPWILLCICGAMIVSFLYIIIMRWIAGIMVWFSIFAVLALLGFCTYASWAKYDEVRNMKEDVNDTLIAESSIAHRMMAMRSQKLAGTDVIIGVLENQMNAYLRMEETWLAFLIISAAVLVIILLIVIFLRSRIVLAISLINEGSKAVAQSWSALYFPIFPFLGQVGVVCYGVAICLYLLTTGVAVYKVDGLANDTSCHCNINYVDGSLCTVSEFEENCKTISGPCQIAACLYVANESNTIGIYLQLYNLFTFFWALFFVSGLGQIILASTFATYYWTYHKENIPYFTVATSAWRVFRYHLGTVAFGSLLLAFVNWLRVLMEVAFKNLEKYDNAFVKAVKCCMRCFFWCLEKFLRFINKNAFIMCAIHGKNFCTSAKDAFSLLLRNCVRVFVLDKVTDFLFFINKLVITAAVGAASFYIFSRPVIRLQDTGDSAYQTSYYFIPIFFTCIGAYFIASIFFNVYSMAVDTMFLCFLEDCDINDGSQEKPYFMSKNLMKILGKKNKIEQK